jgi:spore germination protein KC
MKKSVFTVLIVFAVIVAFNRGHNLPRMTEITLAEPVFVIGVDKSGQDVKLSLIYEKIESSDEGGGDVNKKYTESVTANSASGAMERLKKRFPREMAFSTADYFLIGEDAARESLAAFTEFLSRNNTLRLTASVFVVQSLAGSDFPASRACEILSETKTLDILRNFGENSGINAVSSRMKFYELLSKEAGERSAYTIPALIIKEHGGGFIAVPSGYAIIKEGRLLGFMDAEAARGYNILTNKSSYSVIETKEAGLSARLESSKRRIKFNFDGDVLTDIDINVEIRASVTDGNSPADSSGEKEINRVIFAELQRAVGMSKTFNCDFIGFGEALRMRHPYRWERLKDNWDEIYNAAPVKINTTTRTVTH